jgi:hypothetical protein
MSFLDMMSGAQKAKATIDHSLFGLGAVELTENGSSYSRSANLVVPQCVF